MGNAKKILWFLIVSAVVLCSFSCTNAGTKKTGNQVGENADTADATLKYYKSIVFLLPSPGEILERFYDTNLKYKPELLNSTGNKDKYLGSKAQTLNLGVYITDMSYSALFERSAETVKYLEAIQSLSTEVGISSSIFESLLVRSKANAGKIDSLVSISNEAFGNMLEFLESGGRESTLAQVSAGAYIESLYIALESITAFSDDDKTLELLADMKYPMDNLLEKAKSIAEDDSTNSLVNYINQITIIFNELETKGSKTIITQEKKGEISIMGGEKMILNKANFNKLKDQVSKIRNNIVSFQ
jgi:hypothetical protein